MLEVGPLKPAFRLSGAVPRLLDRVFASSKRNRTCRGGPPARHSERSEQVWCLGITGDQSPDSAARLRLRRAGQRAAPTLALSPNSTDIPKKMTRDLDSSERSTKYQHKLTPVPATGTWQTSSHTETSCSAWRTCSA